MPKLVRRHLEVQAIYRMTIMTSLFTKNRCYCLGDALSIDVAHIGTFLCGTSDDVLPYSLELRVGQRAIVAIGNNVVRSGLAPGFTKAFSEIVGDRNIPMSCFRFQLCTNHRAIVFREPRPANGDVWHVTIKVNAVPL